MTAHWGRAARVLALGGVLLAPALACRARAEAPLRSEQSAVSGDSVRGVVHLLGSEPARLALHVLERNERIALVGDASAPLRSLTGTEVMVMGRWSASRDPMVADPPAPVLNVEWFVVRAVGGDAALDGTVESADGDWYLRTRDGTRHRVPHLPASLRAQPGARVYLVGPLDRAPAGYGIVLARSSTP